MKKGAENWPLRKTPKEEISPDSFSVFDTILSEDFNFEIDDDEFGGEIIIENNPNPNADLDLDLPFNASPQGISRDSSLVQDTNLLKHVPFDDDDDDDGNWPPLRKTQSLPSLQFPLKPQGISQNSSDMEEISQDYSVVEDATLLKVLLPIRRSQSLPSFSNGRAQLSLKATPQGISQASSLVQDTTLLKHLPYYGDEETICSGNSAMEVGSLFEVVSVKICHDEDASWEHFEIYGEISIIVEKGDNKSFYFYQRKVDDPELVSLPDHGFLSLHPCPIAPVMKGNVIFNLTDKTNGTHFKEEKYVEYSITDVCGDDKTLTVQGKGGYYVEMIYTIVPFAQLVKVGPIKFFRPPEPEMDKIEVVGDIIGNDISILKEKYFEAGGCNGGIAWYSVKQSRTMFAVPLHKIFPLQIMLHHDGTELMKMTRGSHPWGVRMSDILFFDCKDKKRYFTANVNWYSPPDYFELNPPLINPVKSEEYVEVFSVYFGGGDSTHALCGSIIVQDPKKRFYIFSRNHKYPDKLSLNKHQLFMRTVSLAWPDWWVSEKNFRMQFELQDNQGNPVISVCHLGTKFGDQYPTRYDRRICAVTRGVNGHFLAVHYSIFKNGLRATVTVVCEGPCSSFDVYGSAYAEYSNYNYNTAYDQNYYRIIVFNKSEEYCAKVENCSELPLSKSKITAPSDCGHIIVFVDLTVRPNMASSNDIYAIGKCKFKTHGVGTEHIPIYSRQSCMLLGRVTVKVEWNL